MNKIILSFVAALMLVPCFPQSVKAQATGSTELTNLVIFIRFSDDEEITYPFDTIDRMFNSQEPGYLSVYNYFDALTYGRIHYNTVYTNNIQNGVIVSYVDIMPRGYYQPYSDNNPIGYTTPNPMIGISMREAQLQARAFHYVDSLHLVDDSVVLDGNGDGFIDNVSFIIKGGTGEWASLLWPHMEYFPHDSIDHPVVVNGVRPNTFNFEFEGAPVHYFDVNTFRHEMGHSLNLPDLYHYLDYTNVSPAGNWDQMHYSTNGGNHIAAIYKNKILHVSDDPIEITCDGDYTLHSVGSSSEQNCYYIRSAIDSTQWYVLEYRHQSDLFEAGIPGTGLIVARWNDTVPLDYRGMFANGFFDFFNQAHQYWIFRPGSTCDTIDGDLLQAHFSQASGRTSFGPSTDPHPHLTDGTPEQSFEITDIRENGTELTFHVHFLNQSGIAEQPSSDVIVYYADGHITVKGAEGETVQLFDIMGRRMGNYALATGVYMVKVGSRPAKKIVVTK